MHISAVELQLKTIEIQTAENVWQDVTTEWLNYGIAGPNLYGRPCGDPTPDAIIRLQRLRDNNEPSTRPTCSYAASTASTDYWPNVLYDPREGAPRGLRPRHRGGVDRHASARSRRRAPGASRARDSR